MNQTVTLLLLLQGGPLTPSERNALSTFQRREKVVLTTPVPRIPTAPNTFVAPGLAEEVVSRIEAALDEAETLAASLDEAKALTVLADVERDLLLHPELPQAAWLMAERHRLAAAIRGKQPDGAAEAEALLASARALEGPRAAAFGEEPVATRSFAAPIPLDVRPLERTDVFVLDGIPAARGEKVLPGRHHARLIRDSFLAWSSWFEVPAQTGVQTLYVPARLACSEDDLAGVELGPRSPSVPVGVRCERWIGVRRGNGRLEVSWCEKARCTGWGPLLYEAPVEPPARLPPWVAATIVGAATLGAGSILIFTGAFERERPPPVRQSKYLGPP